MEGSFVRLLIKPLLFLCRPLDLHCGPPWPHPHCSDGTEAARIPGTFPRSLGCSHGDTGRHAMCSCPKLRHHAALKPSHSQGRARKGDNAKCWKGRLVRGTSCAPYTT